MPDPHQLPPISACPVSPSFRRDLSPNRTSALRSPCQTAAPPLRAPRQIYSHQASNRARAVPLTFASTPPTGKSAWPRRAPSGPTVEGQVRAHPTEQEIEQVQEIPGVTVMPKKRCWCAPWSPVHHRIPSAKRDAPRRAMRWIASLVAETHRILTRGLVRNGCGILEPDDAGAPIQVLLAAGRLAPFPQCCDVAVPGPTTSGRKTAALLARRLSPTSSDVPGDRCFIP